MKFNNLKKIRKRKKLTQRNVSVLAGINERLYQNYEYGIVTPNVYTAMKIADILNSNVYECFPIHNNDNIK